MRADDDDGAGLRAEAADDVVKALALHHHLLQRDHGAGRFQLGRNVGSGLVEIGGLVETARIEVD